MRVARQHPLHLQVPTRSNNGKFPVGLNGGQDNAGHQLQPQQQQPPSLSLPQQQQQQQQQQLQLQQQQQQQSASSPAAAGQRREQRGGTAELRVPELRIGTRGPSRRTNYTGGSISASWPGRG